MNDPTKDWNGPPVVRESGCSLPENVLPSGARPAFPTTCPKCRASRGYAIWACGSWPHPNGTVVQTDRCRIAELEQENAAMRDRLAMAAAFQVGKVMVWYVPSTGRWISSFGEEGYTTAEAAIAVAKEIEE